MEFVDTSTAGRAGTLTSPHVGRAAPSAANGANGITPDPSTPDGIRGNEGGQPIWRVRCGDLISRDRCVTVFVDGGEVVLVGPPGESARLTPNQVGQLKVALNEAAKLAER